MIVFDDLKFDHKTDFGDPYAIVHLPDGFEKAIIAKKSSSEYVLADIKDGKVENFGSVYAGRQEVEKWLENYQKEYCPTDKGASDVHYQKDGKTIDYTKDEYGREIHYLEDGKTIDYFKDEQGNEVHLTWLARKYLKRLSEKEKKEICYGGVILVGRLTGITNQAGCVCVKDENGELSHFGLGPAAWIKDKDGNEVHLQLDEKLSWTKDKDGNEVHYKGDGETVHHTVSKDGVWKFADGIKDNIVAQKRRYLAEKMGLRNVKTSRKYRQVEAFMAEKIFKNK